MLLVFTLSIFYIVLIWVFYRLCIPYLKRSGLRITGIPFEQSSSQSQKGSQEKTGARRNDKKRKEKKEVKYKMNL